MFRFMFVLQCLQQVHKYASSAPGPPTCALPLSGKIFSRYLREDWIAQGAALYLNSSPQIRRYKIKAIIFTFLFPEKCFLQTSEPDLNSKEGRNVPSANAILAGSGGGPQGLRAPSYMADPGSVRC